MKRFLSGFLALVLGVGVSVSAYSNNYKEKPITLKSHRPMVSKPVDPEPEH